ncbi:hypothetical protein H310_12611 [Aphanomyces invadans]|uniref:Uncharacterized protein n=1 Tax=Aphanomyces invadans TaxID=157072 RepID=A0A024TID4_9STRA|nr:hypothetical protein H310_12611 [Aphanomyces invadans]ETV93346.1 hypothetical protein H310_12611 [Aphanomyces invadans]|eukprot:XP_008877982.1 hypothetical protein H310_12611 [Aphanomyces invadans]
MATTACTKDKRRYPVKEELTNLRVEAWHLETKLMGLQRLHLGSVWKQVAHHEAHARHNALQENAALKQELDVASQWIHDMQSTAAPLTATTPFVPTSPSLYCCEHSNQTHGDQHA